MNNNILVFLEQRDGIIKKSSFETLCLAEELNKSINGSVIAIIVGGNVINTDDITKYSNCHTYYVKDSSLTLYCPDLYKRAVVECAYKFNAGIALFANTSMGKDLAPRVAVKLNAGCLADCIKIEADGDKLVATRPAFAGKVLEQAVINTEIKVFTIRPNTFKLKELSSLAGPSAEIVQFTDDTTKERVVAIIKNPGKKDIAEADIIVSGGRGLNAPENFALLEELADVLGGAVGASRPVVDAGWRPHDEQIGQTGKTVSPDLYIACGISGAIQHIAGMASSKCIVAINKDKDAPIFSITDYGICGDLFEIIPALTDEIKKLKLQ